MSALPKPYPAPDPDELDPATAEAVMALLDATADELRRIRSLQDRFGAEMRAFGLWARSAPGGDNGRAGVR